MKQSSSFSMYWFFENLLSVTLKSAFVSFVFWAIAVAEWESRVVVECNEIDGFHIVVVNSAENDESTSQNDLLLLSKVKVIDLTNHCISEVCASLAFVMCA